MENSYRQLDIFDIEVLLQMVEHAQARATKDARRDPTNDVPLIAMRFYKTTADKLRAMAADMAADMGDEA